MGHLRHVCVLLWHYLHRSICRLDFGPVEIVALHAIKSTEDEQVPVENGTLVEGARGWLQVKANLASPSLSIKVVLNHVVEALLSEVDTSENVHCP